MERSHTAASSAAQPASMERPAASLEASSSEHYPKRSKTSRAPSDSNKVSVAFIICEDLTCDSFMTPVANALDAGADMINIILATKNLGQAQACDYKATRGPIFNLKLKLTPLFDAKWTAWDHSVIPPANVMSFYSRNLASLIHREGRIVFLRSNYGIAPEDMKHIYNDLRHDVESWMRPSTIIVYSRLLDSGRRGEAQVLLEKTFSSYRF